MIGCWTYGMVSGSWKQEPKEENLTTCLKNIKVATIPCLEKKGISGRSHQKWTNTIKTKEMPRQVLAYCTFVANRNLRQNRRGRYNSWDRWGNNQSRTKLASMYKNQQDIINLLGYMVLAPTKETPAKNPRKRRTKRGNPHLSKPARYSIMIRLIQQYVK